MKSNGITSSNEQGGLENREKRRERTMFVVNLFKFTKATLDGTKRGSLQLKPCNKSRKTPMGNT